MSPALTTWWCSPSTTGTGTPSPRRFHFSTSGDLPFTLYLATDSIESGVALGPVPGAEPLTWDQIGKMADTGLVDRGSPYPSPPGPARQSSAEAVEEELGTSDALIEDRLGIRPAHFAYPWGFWSARADGPSPKRYRTAALAGVASGASKVDPLHLPRYPVQLSDGFRWFPGPTRRGIPFGGSGSPASESATPAPDPDQPVISLKVTLRSRRSS